MLKRCVLILGLPETLGLRLKDPPDPALIPINPIIPPTVAVCLLEGQLTSR